MRFTGILVSTAFGSGSAFLTSQGQSAPWNLYATSIGHPGLGGGDASSYMTGLSNPVVPATEVSSIAMNQGTSDRVQE